MQPPVPSLGFRGKASWCINVTYSYGAGMLERSVENIVSQEPQERTLSETVHARTGNSGPNFSSWSCWILPLLALFLFSCHTVLAATVAANPGNYRALVKTLMPGDTLQLRAGTYEAGLLLSNLHGEPGKPITISGPQNGFPAIFLGSRTGSWNTVQIENSSYLCVRYLKLDGLGVDGVDGVNARGITHHITIEHLKILRHGASQLTVGIATRGPAWDWVIRNNLIVGAGTGIYLGASDGRNPFVRGLIEYNLIRDTLGYNMQIKHQKPWPHGVGLPEEPSTTIIRHNVFSKAKNAATDSQWTRPNLLVGHWPLSGPGQRNHYEIYGNFFYQNPSEALFQGEGNLALYDNVFVNDFGPAVNIQRHNDRPRAVSVFHNTIVASGKGIRLVHGMAAYEQKVVANAVFASPALDLDARVIDSENTVGARSDADDYLNAPSARLGELDLYPESDAALTWRGDLKSFSRYTDFDRDFNGTLRRAPFRGAYAGSGRNPGWTLALDIMPLIRGDGTVNEGKPSNGTE
jgi:hypothetical protein